MKTKLKNPSKAIKSMEKWAKDMKTESTERKQSTDV